MDKRLKGYLKVEFVLWALRIVIFLFDKVIRDTVIREKLARFIPSGLWEAYCSFHEIERVVRRCACCGDVVQFTLVPPGRPVFCYLCELRAEAMAGSSW